MLVFENGGWQIGESPDTNYLEGTGCKQPDWVIPDDSALAAKIMAMDGFVPVTNEKGELVDVALPEPTAEEKISKLKQQLSALDLQAVRPLRAIAAGTATDEDKSRLAEIEGQAETLRAEIANLGKAVTE